MLFFTRSAQPARKNHTVMPSTNLSDGTVLNLVWHLPSTINVRLAAVRRLQKLWWTRFAGRRVANVVLRVASKLGRRQQG